MDRLNAFALLLLLAAVGATCWMGIMTLARLYGDLGLLVGVVAFLVGVLYVFQDGD